MHSPVKEGWWNNGTSLSKGREDGWGLTHLKYKESLRELNLLSLKKSLREDFMGFTTTLWEGRSKTLRDENQDRGRINEHKLEHRKILMRCCWFLFVCFFKKKRSAKKMINHWNELSKNLVESLFLKTVRSCLDSTLNNMI